MSVCFLAILGVLVTHGGAVHPSVESEGSAPTLDLDGDGVADRLDRHAGQTVVRCGLSDAILGRWTGERPKSRPPIEPRESASTARAPFEAEGTLALVPNLFSGDVSLVDLQAGIEVARLPLGERPRYAAMSGDGRFGYVTADAFGDTTGIWVVDLLKRQHVDTIALPAFRGSIVQISPDDRWLLGWGETASPDTVPLLVVDTEQRRLAYRLDFGSPGSAGGFAFSPDGSQLTFLEAGDRMVVTIEVATGELIQRYPYPDPLGLPFTPSQVEFMQDRPVGFALFATGPWPPLHLIFPEQQGFQSVNPPLSVPPMDMELARGDSLMVFGNVSFGSGTGIEVWDLEHDTVTSLSAPKPARSLSVHPNGREVWGITPGQVQGDGRFQVFDLDLGTRTSIPATIGYCYPNLTPDGRRFVATDNDSDRLVMIDTETHELSTVPVGDNPRGAYIQGLNRTREYGGG